MVSDKYFTIYFNIFYTKNSKCGRNNLSQTKSLTKIDPLKLLHEVAILVICGMNLKFSIQFQLMYRNIGQQIKQEILYKGHRAIFWPWYC